MPFSPSASSVTCEIAAIVHTSFPIFHQGSHMLFRRRASLLLAVGVAHDMPSCVRQHRRLLPLAPLMAITGNTVIARD